MQKLSTHEKIALIREHGNRLSMAFCGVPVQRKSDIISRAKRVIELANAIPASEYAKD